MPVFAKDLVRETLKIHTTMPATSRIAAALDRSGEYDSEVHLNRHDWIVVRQLLESALGAGELAGPKLGSEAGQAIIPGLSEWVERALGPFSDN